MYAYYDLFVNKNWEIGWKECKHSVKRLVLVEPDMYQDHTVNATCIMSRFVISGKTPFHASSLSYSAKLCSTKTCRSCREDRWQSRELRVCPSYCHLNGSPWKAKMTDNSVTAARSWLTVENNSLTHCRPDSRNVRWIDWRVVAPPTFGHDAIELWILTAHQWKMMNTHDPTFPWAVKSKSITMSWRTDMSQRNWFRSSSDS